MRSEGRLTRCMMGFLLGLVLVCNEGPYWITNLVGLAIMAFCGWRAHSIDRERRARGWKGNWYSGRPF